MSKEYLYSPCVHVDMYHYVHIIKYYVEHVIGIGLYLTTCRQSILTCGFPGITPVWIKGLERQ